MKTPRLLANFAPRHIGATGTCVSALLLLTTLTAPLPVRAIDVKEFLSLSPDARSTMIRDRITVILSWLDKNDPQTTLCFLNTFDVSADADAAGNAIDQLVDRIDRTPNKDRDRTVLARIVIDWIREDVCPR